MYMDECVEGNALRPHGRGQQHQQQQQQLLYGYDQRLRESHLLGHELVLLLVGLEHRAEHDASEA